MFFFSNIWWAILINVYMYMRHIDQRMSLTKERQANYRVTKRVTWKLTGSKAMNIQTHGLTHKEHTEKYRHKGI